MEGTLEKFLELPEGQTQKWEVMTSNDLFA